jgi:ariadne-1
MLKFSFMDNDSCKDKYERNLLNTYIEKNKYIKYCPSVPHCGNIVKINSDEPLDQNVICDCAMEFCFICLGDPHNPATCEMIQKWKGKSEEEYLSNKLIRESTRACPSCKKPITKNGGCNHMVGLVYSFDIFRLVHVGQNFVGFVAKNIMDTLVGPTFH